MTDLPAVIGSRPLRPRSSACPRTAGEGARTPSRGRRGGTGRLLLLASLAGLNLAVARPAAAANCGVTFHDLPAVQIARGGSTDLPIPYETDGPCTWRITPSVEANPLGITGTFIYSPAPAQPSNTSLILGTLTAPSAA